MRTTEQRFSEKVRVDEETGCWIWVGAKGNGYGRFWDGYRTLYAHRWAWETHRGLIPEGMELDHFLMNDPATRDRCSRACVNPDHLEVVSHGENARRSPFHAENGRSSPFIVRMDAESAEITQACPICLGTGQVGSAAARGASLRKLRESKGLSLRALAKRLETSYSTLSNVERGKHPRANWRRWEICYREALGLPQETDPRPQHPEPQAAEEAPEPAIDPPQTIALPPEGILDADGCLYALERRSRTLLLLRMLTQDGRRYEIGLVCTAEDVRTSPDGITITYTDRTAVRELQGEDDEHRG